MTLDASNLGGAPPGPDRPTYCPKCNFSVGTINIQEHSDRGRFNWINVEGTCQVCNYTFSVRYVPSDWQIRPLGTPQQQEAARKLEEAKKVHAEAMGTFKPCPTCGDKMIQDRPDLSPYCLRCTKLQTSVREHAQSTGREVDPAMVAAIADALKKAGLKVG